MCLRRRREAAPARILLSRRAGSTHPKKDEIMTNATTQSSRDRRLWTAVGSLTALAAVASALLVFGGPKAQANANAAPAQATPVSVAAVSESEVTAWDEFSGRLEAVERVDVRSRVAGAVQAVHFREGALVQKGDLLITIDPAPYSAEAERAEAQVAAARARF